MNLAAGLLGAFLHGFGSGRDYGWARRERVAAEAADAKRRQQIVVGLQRFKGMPNNDITRALVAEHVEAVIQQEYERHRQEQQEDST